MNKENNYSKKENIPPALENIEQESTFTNVDPEDIKVKEQEVEKRKEQDAMLILLQESKLENQDLLDKPVDIQNLGDRIQLQLHPEVRAVLVKGMGKKQLHVLEMKEENENNNRKAETLKKGIFQSLASFEREKETLRNTVEKQKEDILNLEKQNIEENKRFQKIDKGIEIPYGRELRDYISKQLTYHKFGSSKKMTLGNAYDLILNAYKEMEGK